jgi:hypothetical protein
MLVPGVGGLLLHLLQPRLKRMHDTRASFLQEEKEEEEKSFVFKDTIEGPRASLFITSATLV